MDFSVSPEQQALREAVGAIAAGFGGGYFARVARHSLGLPRSY